MIPMPRPVYFATGACTTSRPNGIDCPRGSAMERKPRTLGWASTISANHATAGPLRRKDTAPIIIASSSPRWTSSGSRRRQPLALPISGKRRRSTSSARPSWWAPTRADRPAETVLLRAPGSVGAGCVLRDRRLAHRSDCRSRIPEKFESCCARGSRRKRRSLRHVVEVSAPNGSGQRDFAILHADLDVRRVELGILQQTASRAYSVECLRLAIIPGAGPPELHVNRSETVSSKVLTERAAGSPAVLNANDLQTRAEPDGGIWPFGNSRMISACA